MKEATEETDEEGILKDDDREEDSEGLKEGMLVG